VTGTLAAGRLAVDDRVEVYPKGVEAKVRGLQTHGHPVPEARAGQRTAVNLQGVERAALERGDVLAHAGTLVPAVLVDGTLELLPDAPRGLKTRTRVRFHAGTSEIMARVLLLDRAALAPEARAGQRTAVNLQGVERAALERGDVLAHAGTLVPAVLVDGTLELLPDAPRGLKTRTRVRFHAGTSEIMARVLLLDRAELAP